MKKDIDPGFEEQEREFIDRTCGTCPHNGPVDPYIQKLLYYMAIEDGNCRLERHELVDHEWIDKGRLRHELERLQIEDARNNPRRGDA